MSQSSRTPSGDKARYRNSFYEPLKGHDPEFYLTDAKPEAYRGYLIYQRIKGRCWDVVQRGVCIGQYAGRSGATGFIDRLMDGGATEWELEKAGRAVTL